MSDKELDALLGIEPSSHDVVRLQCSLQRCNVAYNIPAPPTCRPKSRCAEPKVQSQTGDSSADDVANYVALTQPSRAVSLQSAALAVPPPPDGLLGAPFRQKSPLPVGG